MGFCIQSNWINVTHVRICLLHDECTYFFIHLFFEHNHSYNCDQKNKTADSLCVQMYFIPSYRDVQLSSTLKFIAFRDRAAKWSTEWNRLLKDSCWKDGFFKFHSNGEKFKESIYVSARWLILCLQDGRINGRHLNYSASLNRFHFWTTRISLPKLFRWWDLFQLATNISCEFIRTYTL